MIATTTIKKKRTVKKETIDRGRPPLSITHRHTLPGVRVLDSQYKKLVRLALKKKQTMSATIRQVLDSAL